MQEYDYDPRSTFRKLTADNIVLHNGELFTNEIYLSENLFLTERKIEFVFNDSTIFNLPPMKDFQLTCEVTLRMNKLEDWNINIRNLEDKWLFNSEAFDLETVRLLTWEVALLSFGYQVDMTPFEYSDDGYEYYLQELERMKVDKEALSESEIKSLQLAVEYLHLVNFFKNSRLLPMYLANRKLIRDWEALETYLVVEKMDERVKEAYTNEETTEKALRKVPQELFVRTAIQGKTSYSGMLTPLALEHIEYWIRANMRNTTDLKGNTLVRQANNLVSWVTTEVKV